jgi:hypothetical protein
MPRFFILTAVVVTLCAVATIVAAAGIPPLDTAPVGLP